MDVLPSVIDPGSSSDLIVHPMSADRFWSAVLAAVADNAGVISMSIP